jgi:hypothetical protein
MAKPIIAEGRSFATTRAYAAELHARFGVSRGHAEAHLRLHSAEATLAWAKRLGLRPPTEKPASASPVFARTRERAIHFGTGRRIERLYLGACFTGELRLQFCEKSPRLDLLWVGASPVGVFDQQLRALITACWKNLCRITGRDLPQPRPVPCRPAVWWLARLAPGLYATEHREGGGFEVFELLPPRIVLRRPQA